MAQPTPYDRQSSFSNIQAQAPSDPLPGSTLDAEFNAAKETLDEILTNLALIQRDDGALANASVGLDQLAAEIEVGWNAPTVWVTGTAYVAGDTVFNGSAFYRLLVEHTAGTFATDLAAGKWELIVDLSGLAIVAASQIANTPSGSISATTVQAAIDELASEKAATSHTHPSSAITDGTAAGRTLLTAVDAAAQRTALGLGALALEDTIAVTDIDAQIAFSGIIEPAALAASVNDWTPTGIATCSTIRVSASTSGVEITGILAPAVDGEIRIIENVGTTYPITLPPSSASSAAANRFLFPKPVVIGPNSSAVLKYDLDGTTPRWRLLTNSAKLPRGWIDGLTLSNNVSDTTNDIDIAAGQARGARGILDLELTTALTGKRLDADWAAGSAAGMRYTTAITNTTYHIFLIGKADGTTDVFAYAGVDPTSVLPTGYIDYHMIGSIIRSSGAILQFIQYNDTFLLKVPSLEVSQTIGTTATSLVAGAIPTGINVEAILNAYVAVASTTAFLWIYSTDISDAAVDATAAPLATVGTVVSSVASVAGFGQVRVRTSTSAQIRYVANTSITVRVASLGWIHPRGRNL